jgi:hypothetical protein
VEIMSDTDPEIAEDRKALEVSDLEHKVIRAIQKEYMWVTVKDVRKAMESNATLYDALESIIDEHYDVARGE